VSLWPSDGALRRDGRAHRANQGHSVEVDLQLTPVTPPETLYHGTGERVVPAMLNQGLLKMKRHHVHLSPDISPSLIVGRRHGHPFVFQVDAGVMARAGIHFLRSENGVWLTDHVPPHYLTVVEAPDEELIRKPKKVRLQPALPVESVEDPVRKECGASQ